MLSKKIKNGEINPQKSPKTHGGIRLFGNLKVMVVSALFCALSIVLGKYLAFNITDSIRLSFENLPILMAGMFFGPVVGGVVGLAADLLGCMAVGYTPIPLVAVGGTLIGVVSGIVAWYVYPRKSEGLGSWGVYLPVYVAHVVGSILVKSVGLSLYNGIPLPITMGWRTLTYLVIAFAEGGLIMLLMKNKLFAGELQKLLVKKGGRK